MRINKRHGTGGWSGKRGEGQAIKWIRDHAGYTADYCLMWPFSAGPGYGMFGYLGKHHYAHRFMCELVHGPAPTPRHQAAHSCGNGRKGCCNPRHLSWKTNGENQKDRRRHGTANRYKFTPEMDAELRRLAKSMTQMELAAHFGVTHSTIQYRLYGGSHQARRQKLFTVA